MSIKNQETATAEVVGDSSEPSDTFSKVTTWMKDNSLAIHKWFSRTVLAAILALVAYLGVVYHTKVVSFFSKPVSSTQAALTPEKVESVETTDSTPAPMEEVTVEAAPQPDPVTPPGPCGDMLPIIDESGNTVACKLTKQLE